MDFPGQCIVNNYSGKFCIGNFSDSFIILLNVEVDKSTDFSYEFNIMWLIKIYLK
jgi:hypothetical protein